MKIVFDLDGTLADCAHRLHFIQGENKDWNAFYASCHDDEPIWQMIQTLGVFLETNARVEIWTGRREDTRQKTWKWLNGRYLKLEKLEALRMRPVGDHREDSILKAEWLATAIAADQKPDLVFEDRQQVVDMYRSRGIRVAQVAKGDY